MNEDVVSLGDFLESVSNRDIDEVREELTSAGSSVPARVRNVLKDIPTVKVSKMDHLSMAKLAVMLWAWADGGLKGVDDLLGNRQALTPVFYGRRWYFYRSSGENAGTWVMAPASDAKKAVHWLPAMARWNRGMEGDTEPVRINRNLQESVAGLMEVSAAQDDFFDEPARGLCFSNGFLTDRLELIQHHPSQRSRTKLDYEWNPSASCKPFMTFLDQVWHGEDDLEDRKLALGQWLGAAILGQSTTTQRAIMMLGEGSNGKSIMMDTLMTLFHKSDVVSVAPQQMKSDCEMAHLKGARLNLVADIPTRDLIDSGTFKQAVVGDQCHGRHLYQGPIDFVPIAGHCFSANALPKTIDLSNGFFRRWLFLKFNRTFTPKTEGFLPPDVLTDRLVACRSGIAAWAVRCWTESKMKGLFIPASSEAVKAEWLAGSDQLSQFVLDRLRPAHHDVTPTPSSKVYSEYTDWAKACGHKIMSANTFGQRIKKVQNLNGYVIESKRGTSGRGYNVLIRASNEPTWADDLADGRSNEEIIG